MTIDVTFKPLEDGIRKLQKTFDDESIVDELEVVAQALIKRAIDAPVPSDTRALANSGDSLLDRSKKKVIFGFNRSYAAWQDAPGQSTPHIIRPRRKKWLYVPISQRGRLHRIGNNPENEGLKFGGFVRRIIGKGRASKGGSGEADYVLAKEVHVPIKPYGSAVGPNHYFSETLKRNKDFALKALAARLEKRLRDKLGGSS